jgi:uncharacterized coiled-coil protein SlyX
MSVDPVEALNGRIQELEGDLARLRQAARAAALVIEQQADELMRQQQQLDAMLQHCPDAECMQCGTIICPLGEPLHFHHDGCPACAETESRSTN